MIKNSNKKITTTLGFTLVEIVLTVSILALMLGVVGAFQSDIFSLNRFIQVGLKNQSEAKKIVRPFANEVRGAVPSNLGAYPIAEAETTSFSFYSDIDNDGLNEKVRYYLEGNDFKKSVIKPTGQPLVYDLDNENIIRVIEDVINDEIFTYYDSSYDGTASTTSLSYPVTIASIRLVKINLVVDSDVSKPPAPVEVTTQVSIRNLKDNL